MYKSIVILGATSSGKSSLAVKLAKDFNGEIISADSRQIFKDMNLGTGKVEGKWEKLKNKKFFVYRDIPHHLIDFISPKKNYNVSHFKKDCEEKILDIIKRGKVPIICGGTGFWIQAVVDDANFPEIKPNLKLRQELKTRTIEELFKILKKIDPKRSSTIDKKNRVRLIRAIEITKVLGKVPSPRTVNPSNARKIKGISIEFLQIGISIDQEKIIEKIKTRLKKRFRAGMIEEILNLYKKYDLTQEKINNLGIAYSLVPLYKKKEINQKELFNRIVKAEKNYAKRQNTWFKKDPRIFWNNNYSTIQEQVKKLLK